MKIFAYLLLIVAYFVLSALLALPIYFFWNQMAASLETTQITYLKALQLFWLVQIFLGLLPPTNFWMGRQVEKLLKTFQLIH